MSDEQFNRAVAECKLGMKALQNVRGAILSFEKILTLAESEDSVLLLSLFCASVVQYAKPFSETVRHGKKVRYPVKHLTQIPTFQMPMHRHLMKLRNVFIAHDDLDALEPRLAINTFHFEEFNYDVPMQVGVTNKRLAYPADQETADRIKRHMDAALTGIQKDLFEVMGRLRTLALAMQGERAPTPVYQKSHGPQSINASNVGGTQLVMPSLETDEWMNSEEPAFEDVKNGYRYEKVNFKRDFYGPETIQLPDGSKIVIHPPPLSK
jgi:hypothetical protein